MVIAAGDMDSPRACEALENLCRDYWKPIHAFLRRSGCTAHDAEDLTQSFFERVLSKDWLRAADRNKGKFRSFLLAMLKHFLANHRRDERTQKRGGGALFLCLDDESLNELEVTSVLADGTPEQSFDRQWAMTLLDQVLGRLREEHRQSGKLEMFDALKAYLTGDCGAGTYRELAAKLDTTEAALKMAVSRMRRRYGELLRAEIARTVSSPDAVEDELRALFAALS